MQWTPEQNDHLLVQDAAMKQIVGSLIDRLVGHRRDSYKQIQELYDNAVRNCDVFTWRDADEDRSEMLTELMRDEITRFFSALMNPIDDPKARLPR